MGLLKGIIFYREKSLNNIQRKVSTLKKKNIEKKNLNVLGCMACLVCLVYLTQLKLTCSKLTMKTLEKRCEICSKLTIKTPERGRPGAFVANLPHHFVVLLLSNLNN